MIVLKLKVESHLSRDLDGGKYQAGSRIVIDRLALRDGLLMVHIEEPVKRWIWEKDADLHRYGRGDMGASMWRKSLSNDADGKTEGGSDGRRAR